MLGNKTLFVPGFDHAGISTQSVVEKRLFKSEGKTRHDLGREKFLETVMDWKNESVPVLSSTTRTNISLATKDVSRTSFIVWAAATTGIASHSPWMRFALSIPNIR